MTATQGFHGFRGSKRTYKYLARAANLEYGEKPPEWMTEYLRMLRRERTEYERDRRNELGNWEDMAELPAGSDAEREAVNRVMIDQATASCTADERELLYLVYFEGVSLSALSRESGVPYRTLGYRLNRTLGKCRKNLEPWRANRR